MTMKDDAKWIELQRLLYKMETNPDLSSLSDNENDGHGQSWHSLLFRAQLAQDLWQNHVAPKFSSRYEGDDDGNDGLYYMEEYDKLAQRVDQACRHAQELINHYKQQQRELSRKKKKMQEEEKKRIWQY